jgi:transcriptional regulator with XRE-family HTH domain
MLKNRISELRKAKGIGLEELAERAGLSPGYVSLMASGARNISLKNLEKLATALECHPEELFTTRSDGQNDILDIWASIPPDRRELAKQVLESFIGNSSSLGVDADVRSSVESENKTKKKK